MSQSFEEMWTAAQTEHGFDSSKPVPEELLQKIVELTLLGPTAYNCSPIRLVVVKSEEGKAKLDATLMDGNKAQTKQAPVTLIVCLDHDYETHLPKLMPFVPGCEAYFAKDTPSHSPAMVRNGNLQGGYLIAAIRALGLGAGPMSGFDQAAVDAAFLEGSSWKSNFLINVGYALTEARYPRAPRFAFEEVAKIA
jgi:3-hydroxypropanoate dehydrogenase